MTAFGVSNDLVITQVAETTYGTTPANPNLSRLRINGETMGPNVNYDESDEINPNYDLTDLIATGTEAGGAVPFDFSHYLAFDDCLAAVMRSTWTAGVLKAGVLKPSFSIEKSFLGGGVRQYMSFPGSRYNGITLTGSAGSKMSGSLDVMSISGIPSLTSIKGTGTQVEPAANRIMSLVDMTAFTITGDTTPLILSEFQLSITNNCRRAAGHGQLASYDVLYGMREVALTFSAYFESWEQMTDLINKANNVLSFTIGDGTNSYVFQLPRMKYRSLDIHGESNNSNVMQQIEARGLYDPTAQTSLQITRTPTAG